jgi:hypothetical protein
MTLRHVFRRQESEATHHIESGIDLRWQRNAHDITEDGWRRQPASLEAVVAVVNRGATCIPPEDLESSLRQLDEQSFGAAGRLEQTAHAAVGIQIEAQPMDQSRKR